MKSETEGLISLDELGSSITSPGRNINLGREPSRIPQVISPSALEDEGLWSAYYRRQIMIGQQGIPDASKSGGDNKLGYMQFVRDPYLAYSDKFVFVDNWDDAYSIERQIDKEIKRTNLLANAPWYKVVPIGFVQELALEPINWLSLSMLMTGEGVFVKAMQTGLSALATTAMKELYLHSQQLTRTSQESINNVVVNSLASTALSFLGSAVGAYRKGKPYIKPKTYRDAHRHVQDIMLGLPEPGESGTIFGNVFPRSPKKLQPPGGGLGGAPGNTGAPTSGGKPPSGGAGGGGIVLPPETSWSKPKPPDGTPNESMLANMPKAAQKLMFQTTRNRMMTSEFRTPQELAPEIFDSTFTLAKHKHGVAVDSVEGKVNQRIADDTMQLTLLRSLFKDQAVPIASNPDAVAVPSWTDFEREVIYGLATGEPSQIAQVNDAVAIVRGILDKYGDIAVELGMMDKNASVLNALYYMPISWNRNKIIEFRKEFFDKMLADFEKTNIAIAMVRSHPAFTEREADYEKVLTELNTLRALSKAAKLTNDKSKLDAIKVKIEDAEKRQKLLEDSLRSVAEQVGARVLKKTSLGSMFHSSGKIRGKLRQVRSADQLKDDVNETIDHMIGLDNDVLRYLDSMFSDKPRNLRERTFLHDQVDYLEWQNQSITESMLSFIMNMSRVLTMHEHARSLNPEYKTFIDWHNDMQKKLRKEYNNISGQLSGKAAQNALTEFKRQKENITKSFKMALGVFRNGASFDDNWAIDFLRLARTYHFTTSMGSAAISNLTEMATTVFTHGVGRYVYDGLRPLLLDFVKATKTCTKDDLHLSGIAAEAELGGYLSSLVNHQDLSTKPNLFNRTITYTAKNLAKVSGMNLMSDFYRNCTGRVSAARALKDIEDIVYGRATQSQIEHLAQIGLDRKHFAEILKMHSEVTDYATRSGETRLANWGAWKLSTADRIAAYDAFRRAVLREVNNSTTRTSLGSKPDWLFGKVGPNVAQFRDWMFAIYDKNLLTAIDRKDLNSFAGMAMMVFLGMLIYIIYGTLRGEDIDTSFENLAFEGFDKSGLLAPILEPYNMAGTIFKELPTTSRNRNINVGGAFGGPTVGKAQDLATLLYKLYWQSDRHVPKGEVFTTNELYRLARFIPYQNLWYTYYLSRLILDGIGDELELKPAYNNKLYRREKE